MKSPLTGLDSCSIIRTLDALSIAKRWRNEMNISWAPPASVEKILYCKDPVTGLHFYSPSEIAGGAYLYSQLQRFPWYYMHNKWEFDLALELLKSTGPRILEVGVGNGAFLAKAKDVGLHVSGIELNPDGARAAKDKGFNIIEKDMTFLLAEDASTWDSICAFQVLEHLAQPRKFLDEAISLLRPGGLLVLSVPNAAVARKLDPYHNNLLDQPPHHMSHWDEGVFRSLEFLLPLKLRNVMFETLSSYHVNWFVDSWSQQLHSKYGQFAGRLLLNRVTMPIVKMILYLGVRKLIRGHTMMVCFEKLG